MKTAAAIVALIVALVLLGGAFFDYIDDVNNTSSRISQGFRDMHNEAAFVRDMKDIDDRRSSEGLRAIAGAAFLIGALALFSRSSSPESEKPDSQLSLFDREAGG